MFRKVKSPLRFTRADFYKCRNYYPRRLTWKQAIMFSSISWILIVAIVSSPFIFIYIKGKQAVKKIGNITISTNEPIGMIEENITHFQSEEINNDITVSEGIKTLTQVTKEIGKEIEKGVKNIKENNVEMYMNSQNEEGELSQKLQESNLHSEEQMILKYLDSKYKHCKRKEALDPISSDISLEQYFLYKEVSKWYNIEIYMVWEIWDISTEYLDNTKEDDTVYILNTGDEYRLIVHSNDKYLDEIFKKKHYKKLKVREKSIEQLEELDLPGGDLTEITRKKKYGY